MQIAINPTEPFEKILNQLIIINKCIKEQTDKYIELPETPLENITEKNKPYLISPRNEIYKILSEKINDKEKYKNLINIIEGYYPQETWENQIPKLGLCRKLINNHMDLF